MWLYKRFVLSSVTCTSLSTLTPRLILVGSQEAEVSASKTPKTGTMRDVRPRYGLSCVRPLPLPSLVAHSLHIYALV